MHKIFPIFRIITSKRRVPKEALAVWGLENSIAYRNLSTSELYEIACESLLYPQTQVRPTTLSSTGALVAYSGAKTGRSPKDKRIVEDQITRKEIWWGDVNIPISRDSHVLLEQIALQYLVTRKRLYVVDGYAGWDLENRLRIRVYCTRAYHALFMTNMLIRPNNEELESDFRDIDFHIFNAGAMAASNKIPGVSSDTCVSVNLTDKKMVILGTQYAGEMKKGVFGVCHYLFPKKGILSMHSSANEGQNGDVTLLFGLSGTGKTTLSADPKRKLIGDDEHCWSENGIFNIEGGCYAKCVDLSAEKEPEIFNAIKFGAVLENVEFVSKESRVVNYNDISITENTRVSYPLDFIPGAKNPAIGGHPKNIFFLTCDAYGVLPPVAKLSAEQAMYHFISGYTAKVAGTEMGVKEPQATFSACFGEAFLPLHPAHYAQMLADKMNRHGTKCWLINTGWSGGKYGVGSRMPLKYTRAIIDAIHNGSLENAEFENYQIFDVQIPKNCPGVPQHILNPKNTWTNKEEFESSLRYLAEKFINNFSKYSSKTSESVIKSGPKL